MGWAENYNKFGLRETEQREGRNEVTEASSQYPELIGQEDVIARLMAFTELFASSGGTPGHVLVIGDGGMGQSNIVKAISKQRQVPYKEVAAASFVVNGDFTAVVTNLQKRQLLFLSDIQLLRKMHWENLRSVMSEGRMEITIGKGPAARTHVMEINPFTMVATCPRRLDCPTDLLSEFSLILNLQPYSIPELQGIAERIAKSMTISLEPGAAELIARSSDGRPGHIASTLRRLARATNKGFISEEDVSQAFAAFGIPVRSDSSHGAAGSIGDLSGQDFERLITTLLTRMGFQAEMTRTTGDGGIDIIAVLDKAIVGGRYLFQCKRYALDNLVGAPIVRDFYGAVTADRAVKGIFITTSDFTSQAREFGDRAGVELINLAQLKKLFTEYGLTDLKES